MSIESYKLGLLALNEQILRDVVLPRFPFETLNLLCADPRFQPICSQENLWFHKLQEEYPDLIKPDEFTFQQFYRFIQRHDLPIYYHGDIVGGVPSDLSYLATILDLIYQVEPSSTGSIFIDEHNYPVIVADFSTGTYEQYNENPITRIVLITEPNFTEIPEFVRQDEDELRDYYFDMIQKELLSPLGHPPIYGNKIDKMGYFQVYDRRDESTQSVMCPFLEENHLAEIADLLDLPPGEIRCIDIYRRLEDLGHIL